MLGQVQPILGRLFDGTDGQPGTEDRALISEDLWRSSFGVADGAIGRRMRVDQELLTVIGVLPADFRFPSWDTLIWQAVDFSTRTVESGLPMVYLKIARSVSICPGSVSPSFIGVTET